MSNLRKKLTSKLRDKKDSKTEDKNKPTTVNLIEKDTKKKPEDEVDPLKLMQSEQAKDKKNKDDPLELLGILEDKKKPKENEKEIIPQKDKINNPIPKPIIEKKNDNHINIPKPTNTNSKPINQHPPSTVFNSSKQSNIINKFNNNNKTDSSNILKNINKPHEVKIAFKEPIVPAASIQKSDEENKKKEDANAPKKEEQPQSKFGVPQVEGQKRARYLKRLTDSKAKLNKQYAESKVVKTSDQITEKAKNLEDVIGHTFLEQGEKNEKPKDNFILSGLSDVKQLDDIGVNKGEDNKVKPKHVNLEELLKQENNN